MPDHQHHSRTSPGQRLWLCLVVTLIFSAIEVLAGWLADSLALLGDAGHMLSDSAALALAALATWFAQRPPSERHSYGLGRIEVLAALTNGLFMLVVVTSIGSAAVQRLWQPQSVNGAAVVLVSTVGLILNFTIALFLSRGEQTLNTRGALLHVLGDLLGSVAALLSGIVILTMGWTPIDPILSIVICVLILFSSFGLLKDALHVVMEGVPTHLSLSEVGLAMSSTAGVKSIHDLHIWTLSSGRIALSAHVVVEDLRRWETLLPALRVLLQERFGIEHTTLQPEPFTGAVQLIALPPLQYRCDERWLEPPQGNSSK